MVQVDGKEDAVLRPKPGAKREEDEARMAGTATITVTLQRAEAPALLKVLDIELRVAEALSLIQNTGAAERARPAISAAIGSR